MSDTFFPIVSCNICRGSISGSVSVRDSFGRMVEQPRCRCKAARVPPPLPSSGVRGADRFFA
jgi:hypothetical protein